MRRSAVSIRRSRRLAITDTILQADCLTTVGLGPAVIHQRYPTEPPGRWFVQVEHAATLYRKVRLGEKEQASPLS
jgi:hypothetical protein